MKLSDVAIDRPVFTSMVTLAGLVLGGIAVSRLGVDLFPDITFPLASIVTIYPGAGPEEVEQEVSRVLEESVAGISGIDQVRSTSRDSVSTLIVTFKMEADVRQAVSDVRDHVAMNRARLPLHIKEPVISRVDPTAAAVLVYSAASPTRASMDIRRVVQDMIQPALERLDGVGSVTILGGDQREIRVLVDKDKLESLHLPLAAVSQAIGAESADIPSGRLTLATREMGIKAMGRFQTPSDVGEVVLMAQPNGTQIRVKDVATVVDGVKEARTLTRVNGQTSVTFQVQKQAGTNTVATADRVEAALARLLPRLPGDVKVTKIMDSSRYIRANVKALWNALIEGAIFAILVIFLFMLDWRSTLISAMALPTSVIVTFFVIWLMGFTLNIMSMLGLSLAIGLLIDDSVVVRENIFRHMERGQEPIAAAREGTSEIALAVMATTFTVVAVFVPVAFTGGIIGSMFRQFGLTVAAAVLISLLVSFTLDPMMSARLTQKIAPDHHEQMRRHWFFGPILRVLDGVDSVYRSTLDWALDHRKVVAVLATVAFVGSTQLVKLMGSEFQGEGDQGEFSMFIELAPGTSLAEADRVTAEVERVLHANPDVVGVSTTIGPNEEVNKANLRVKLKPKDQRSHGQNEVIAALRDPLGQIAGLTYFIRPAGLGGDAENALAAAPITLYVRGAQYADLTRVAEEAAALVRRTPGTRDVATSYKPGPPEQRISLNRARAADLGVSFLQAAATLRTAVEGDPAARFRDGDHEIDVRVQMAASGRRTVEDILNLTVASRTGSLVALREFAVVQSAAAPSSIERINRERLITVAAGVAGRSIGDVIADIEKGLAEINLPPGYSFKFAGDAEMMKDTFANLGLALLMAILFIYFVLASQFESLIHPFTIMLSLPLAIVGALALLFLFKFPMNMPAMIGIILLMGLVTKNGILLVDYTNQLRAQGMEIVAALKQAGATRLRPILMTSAAMVLGMLPTALSTAEGAEFRTPMSVGVIGGVITSTLLTLIVVPVVYIWLDKLTLGSIRARRAARRGTPPQAAPAPGVISGGGAP